MKVKGSNYTIEQLDLSVKPEKIDEKYKYLYEYSTVDEGSGYLGHPDSVLLKDGRILTVYPQGHGKGAILSAISDDGGLSYTDKLKRTPESWKKSRETPTVYRLEFSDRPDRLILISGNPRWGMEPTTGGFNCSVSTNEGKSWSEFKLFYSKNDRYICIPIVAMASLTRLKENGVFVDKWMGLFHDSVFHNYKTILTLDANDVPHWSKPVRYFRKYRRIEKKSNMCEVECVRSDKGQGNELCLITRSNSKKVNTMLSFSSDEGKTWSAPVYAPSSLNGERHKAEYLPDGRLFITFRSIERDEEKIKKYSSAKSRPWYSEGWVAWVGTFDDLKNGTEGQYRIKIAHTYLPQQNAPETEANADTGYCGNVILNDGTVVTSTYGIFSPDKDENGNRKTFIVSKRINLHDTDELIEMLKGQKL
ncbi:MAG: glycoside hydrolase [Clostridia bacterium]|nr:glycoside hydrolase [Clostridia bacterium]